MPFCKTGRPLVLMLPLVLVLAGCLSDSVPNDYTAQDQHDNLIDTSDNDFSGERLIIHYRKSDSDAQVQGRALVDQRIARLNTQTGYQFTAVRSAAEGGLVVRLAGVDDEDGLSRAISELQARDDIEHVEIDHRMQPLMTPNDPQYQQQWHLYEPAGGINAPAAWSITTGSNDVVVAVLDTGIRPHADLVDNLLPGYDFVSDVWMANDGDGRDSDASDPGDWVRAGACGNNRPARDTTNSWHGTHVAGTIAAAGNNGVGVTGVAWQAKIVPVRVLGRCGGYTSDIADGIRWAAGLPVAGVPNNPNPAQVINMSLGGTAQCGLAYQRAINDAVNAGATIVVAAGNENQNVANATPANCPNVISVASTNRQGARAFYSNYGDGIHIAAPGGEMSQSQVGGVLSTHNSGRTSIGSDSYAFQQGTSMAAPHVAGIAALMYAVQPNLTHDQVKDALQQTARTFPAVSGSNRCTTSLCGPGIADAHGALEIIGGSEPGPDPEPENRFESNERVDIPDNDRTGVVSELMINRSGNSGVFTVEVDIRHTYRGDLRVALVLPNGARAQLATPSNDSGRDFIRTFRFNGGQHPANGVWRLEVSDEARRDIGYIRAWSITFD
ncbi:S8 family serine peptidase [Salinispirillum sp. LH 10-3-1]|uniref:S8 family serine peptidase n=1 Tax=Salinispirillum sp. LH 10-3-1 TaxID=2952525 RepID=A0AB38YHS9_9GAMM